jgi:hypothetical protein
MSTRRSRPDPARAPAVVLSAFLMVLFAAAPASAAPDSLGTIKQRDGIAIAPDQISISGVSAGGWLAVQYHIAHSSEIMGAGIVAGGPYHCAGGGSGLCLGWSAVGEHDLCMASYICSRTAAKMVFGLYAGPPDFNESVQSAEQEARLGTIDPLAGLKRSRVWIFTGGRESDTPHDTLMPHDVVKGLADFYAALFALPEVGAPRGNIRFVDRVPAEHAMPIARDPTGEAGACGAFAEPYINDCNYPAAAELLSFIYPERQAVADSPPAEDRLQAFAQPVDATDASLSMNAVGHLYVPHACMNGQTCPLHIALHGCEQDEQTVDAGDAPGGGKFGDLPPEKRPYFYRLGGYNAWAEQHGVVILYPQMRADAMTLSQHGCWDWFGYSGPDYYVKSGKQIRAIDAMVACLVGTAACP